MSTIKISFWNETKVIPCPESYEKLLEVASSSFGKTVEEIKAMKIVYKDADNDNISLSSEEDFKIFKASAEKNKETSMKVFFIGKRKHKAEMKLGAGIKKPQPGTFEFERRSAKKRIREMIKQHIRPMQQQMFNQMFKQEEEKLNKKFGPQAKPEEKKDEKNLPQEDLKTPNQHKIPPTFPHFPNAPHRRPHFGGEMEEVPQNPEEENYPEEYYDPYDYYYPYDEYYDYPEYYGDLPEEYYDDYPENYEDYPENIGENAEEIEVPEDYAESDEEYSENPEEYEEYPEDYGDYPEEPQEYPEEPQEYPENPENYYDDYDYGDDEYNELDDYYDPYLDYMGEYDEYNDPYEQDLGEEFEGEYFDDYDPYDPYDPYGYGEEDMNAPKRRRHRRGGRRRGKKQGSNLGVGAFSECDPAQLNLTTKEKELKTKFKVMNNGQVDWTTPVYLKCLKETSEIKGEDIKLENPVKAGESNEFEIKFDLAQAQKGQFKSQWQMYNSENKPFGKIFDFTINCDY